MTGGATRACFLAPERKLINPQIKFRIPNPLIIPYFRVCLADAGTTSSPLVCFRSLSGRDFCDPARSLRTGSDIDNGCADERYSYNLIVDIEQSRSPHKKRGFPSPLAEMSWSKCGRAEPSGFAGPSGSVGKGTAVWPAARACRGRCREGPAPSGREVQGWRRMAAPGERQRGASRGIASTTSFLWPARTQPGG